MSTWEGGPQEKSALELLAALTQDSRLGLLQLYCKDPRQTKSQDTFDPPSKTQQSWKSNAPVGASPVPSTHHLKQTLLPLPLVPCKSIVSGKGCLYQERRLGLRAAAQTVIPAPLQHCSFSFPCLAAHLPNHRDTAAAAERPESLRLFQGRVLALQ